MAITGCSYNGNKIHAIFLLPTWLHTHTQTQTTNNNNKQQQQSHLSIVCDIVLCWLSQAYHNPPLLSWLGAGSERGTGGVTYRHTYIFIYVYIFQKGSRLNPSHSKITLRHSNARSTPLKLIYIISSN